jgi:hypothetical protein
MKLSAILKWLWLNIIFFAPFFLLTWVLIIFFPDVMLRIFGQWAVLMQAVGAKSLRDFTSPLDMFTHILTMNSLTVIVYFVIGLFLQSPLVMLFTGMFYSSIAFLAPFTIGRPFNLNDWLLISVEVFTLILGISLSSALAGDLFDVTPNVKSLLNYWKHNWNQLLPKPADDWKLVLSEWSGTLALVIPLIVALLFFVAWFETYGY